MVKTGSLSGIQVLDLSRMLPGPYCSMILADHGADVIAIERKEYKKDGLFFDGINRNKRHMTLDLKTPEGREIFLKMVTTADVVIEGFRPGVVNRLGIDYESLKRINPQIIYCSISGYGQTGERRNLPGHDVNYISSSGVLSLIGERARPSVIPGVQIADISGGSMNAVTGILLALYARELGGKGQYIDISMSDGILGMLALPHHFAEKSGEAFKVADNILSHRFACYNTYETLDGRYVALGAVENRFWRKLCLHIGQPDFADLQYDELRKDEIISYLREMFLTKTYAEWEKELVPLEICFTGVKYVSEVFDDPTFKSRDMVFEYVDDRGRRKQAIGIPVKLSETPGTIRSIPPGFGADTETILAELGYSKSQVKEFVLSGVV
ncbi:CaiB/BaiF CoA-transferase family protein [Desulforhopalus sp. IMCC35007]|uniref:CaiB/BaiF CoA transferase family protein n=1 Tax=Desulforhopalus sp. IMCC35007 TaxID=2569543 RepID=UPI0010AE58ED|nr:CaiB/BaiF CoA-transferase family protein [Desulforhopalus sp. IMCC35007]TKB09271.1 CoA transferase [Desulforhopalus sp. IMCC35007]